MSEQPTITVSAPSAAAFLGSVQTVNVTFSNTGDAAGFDPFVLLSLDNLGVNGLGTGISFNSATYLGLPVGSTVVTFDSSGDYVIPGSIGADGKPITITGGTPGGQGVLLQLPFGSFTPGQTPADIAVKLNVSANADTAPGKTLAVTATGGFLYGGSAQGDSTTSPTLVTPAATLDFQPTVLTVNSVFIGQGGVTVTGPSNPDTLEVFGDVAAGATVTNETLVETLPNGAVATQVTLSDGQGHSYVYAVDPTTGTLSAVTPGGLPIVTSAAALATAPGVWFNAAANQVEANFGTVLGNATTIGADSGPSIATTYYTGQTQTLGSAELAPAVTTPDLTVTDFLPYGAVAQSFTLTSDNGVFVYSYSAANGVQLTSQTPGSTAPAITAGPGASGTQWVTYDATNGQIVSDFGTIQAGHVAGISAQWQGGQYQQPGTVTQAIGAGQTDTNLTLVDQLNGGAVANSVTLESGANSYVYTVSGNTLTFDAAHSSSPTGEPGVVGSAAALTGAPGVYYDAAHNRIEANFGTVSGGASGSSATIAAGFTGADLIDLTSPTDVPAGSGASAGASYNSSAYGVAAASASLPPNSGNTAIPGQNVITDKVIALQKSVTSAGPVAPGDQLTWTINGEVSNYADIQNIVVTDTLGDGQTFMGTPTLTVVSNGQTIYNAALTDTGVASKNAAGQTILTFNVSQQLLDAGKAGDLNGGAAPTDPTAKPADASFKITFASQVDGSYSATSPTPADPTIQEGDTIANPQAVVSGNLVNGGAPVSATASASVSIPTATLTKSVYEVNGKAYTGQHIQAGDDVTYELTYKLPISAASNVSLTDFLPLPIYSVTDTTGTPGSGFTFDASAAGTTPADGVVTFGPANTLTQNHGLLAGPMISTNTLSNSLTVNVGSIDNAPNVSTGTLDLLFTTKALDQPFIDGLLLTNQVTAQETNSFGAVSTDNAIAQVTLGQPVLNVEKAVVATTGAKDFSGTEGPVTFAAPGMTGVAFTGTIDSANLAATKLSDTLSGAQGGDYERFAVTVENTGSNPAGAFDVVLKDTLPTGFVIPASGLDLTVTNGAGQVLAYSGNPADLFTTGIQLVDPSASQGVLSAYNATSGTNIAVLTYDLEVQPNVAAPNYAMTNTATVTNFAAAANGTNFAVNNPDAGTLSASSTVTTQAPIGTKIVSATSESATGADAQSLKIGETVTYTITETLGQGTLNNVVLNDVLDGNSGHLVFQSGTVTAIGGAIGDSAGVLVGSTLTASGTTEASLNLGTVVVSSDSLNADDTITYTVTAAFEGSNPGNAGGQTLVNSASLTAADPNNPGGTVTTGTASASVHTVAPELTLIKQVEDLTTGAGFSTNTKVTAGDTIEYKVELSNGQDGNAAAAYNVSINDLLTSFGTDPAGNPNVAVDPASLQLVGASSGAVIANDANAAGGGFVVTAGTLATGGSIELTFKGVMAADAVFNNVIANTATYTASTLPSSDATGFARTLTNSATADITTTKPDATKAITASSSIDTTGTVLTIGEVATYTITVAVPEGSTGDLKIVDTLPAGLSYVPGTLGGIPGFTDSGVSVANSLGAPNVVGQAATWDLGAASAPSGGGTITLSFDAQVQNNASTNASGDKLINTVRTYSNGTLDNTNTLIATVSLGGLSGHVWLDHNANGVQDSGDGNLANVTIDLLNNLGVATGATAVTNASGVYTFTNLVDGSYEVKVVTPTGDRFSPVGTTGTAATDSIVDSTGQTMAVAVNAGTITPNQNAAIYQPAQLSGTVFTDQNANGVLNSGDTGIAGQTVTLLTGTGGATGQTAITDSNGNYVFTNLTPGSYEVAVTPVAGDHFSPVGGPASPVDSIVNAAGVTAPVTLASGQTVPNQNAGEYAPASLTGHVWIDQNANGIQQPGDSNLAGVTVSLLNGLGALTGTTAITDVNGFYDFSGLVPGSYAVSVTPPAAEPLFATWQSAASPVDSIVNTTTGQTAPVTLVSGETQPDQNAGVYALAAITGHVFKDFNDNGVQDTGDTNLAGISVQLLTGAGASTGITAVTDSNGAYSFSNLQPGSYEVHVTSPAADKISPQQSTSSPATSIVDATGTTAPITLVSGETQPNENAGLFPPQPNLVITKTTAFTTGEAGDVVTYNVTVAEANGDPNPAFNVAVQDLLAPGETLVSGSEHVSVGTVTESGTGFTFNAGSLLSGQAPITLSYQAVLTSAVYDGEAITNTAALSYSGAPTNGILYTGSTSQTVDAHLVDQFAKSLVTTSQNGGNLVVPGETVSFDLTATVAPGTQHLVLSDALPTGLSAVSATLISEGNATGTVAVGSTFTPSGGVLTADLGILTSPGTSRTAPGDQVVVRVTATVGSNDAYNQLITNQGTLTATTPSGAPQQVLTATSPVQVVQPGTISAFVFLDAQCDGVYHVGDPGMAGVTVRLLDGHGVPTGITTITDSHGEYSFTSLVPGQYAVQVLAPQGTDYSETEHASGNASLDSDVDPITGTGNLLTVGAGQTVTAANAGLEFNGNFAGVTPINIGTGGYDGNGNSGVIVGAGGNLIHTGSGGNNVVILTGHGVPSLVEAGGGHGTDIVTSCGPLNAQTQSASNGFLFAAGSGSDLQGGSGNTYLMGGTGGNNLVANGSGNNVLIAGGPNSELRTGGLSTTILYQVGDGALQVDNGMNSTSTLDVFGTTSGTLEIINSQEYLDLGRGDLIHFNGGTPFDHMTGVITNANAPSDIRFFANINTAPQEAVSFPSSGQPMIQSSASLGVVTAAPIATPHLPITPTVW